MNIKLSNWDERVQRILTPEQLISMPLFWRYLLALFIVITATVLRWMMIPWVGANTPYSINIIAIIVTTIFLGLRPGLLSVILGNVLVEWLVIGSGKLQLDIYSLLRYLVAVSVGVLLCYILHAIRSARDDARNSLKAALAEASKHGKKEEELRISEEKYRHLLQYAPTAIYEVDYKNSRFTSVNDALCLLSGYSKEEMLKMDASEMLDKESGEHFRERIMKVLAGEKIDENVEYRVNVKDGRELWVILNTKLNFKDGKPDSALVVGYDITERRKAEKKLCEKSEELTTLLDSAPAAIFIAHDTDCRHITGNRAAQELLNIPYGGEVSLTAPQELRPLNYKCVKDGQELVNDNLPAQRVAHGETLRDYEFDVVFDNGTVRHVVGNGTPLLNDSGRPRGGILVVADITERKKAEEAVISSELRYRSLFENSYDGVLLTITDGTILSANPAACQMFGMTEEEIVHAGRAGITVLDDKLIAAVKEREGKGEAQVELTMKRKDGSTFEADVTSSIFTDGGGSSKTSMIIRDITDRKKAEEALQKSEQLYKLLINSIPDTSIMLFDKDYRIQIVGGEENEKNNFDKSQLLGKTLWEAYPKNVSDVFEPIHKRILNGETVTFEMPYGEYIYLQQSLPFKDINGNVLGLIQISTNITERKRAEEALRESEERFITLFRSLPLSTTVFQKKGTDFIIKDYNEAANAFTNSKMADFVGKGAIEIYKDHPEIIKKFNIAFEQKITQTYQNSYKKLSTGVDIFLNITLAFAHPDLVIMHSEDKSEQKKAEDRLLYQSNMLATVHDAVIGLDESFIIKEWNHAAEELYGWKADEAIGNSMTELVKAEDISEPYKGITEKMRSGRSFRGERIHHHKHGHKLWVEATANPLFDENGAVIGYVAANRDITERKKAEEALKQSEDKFSKAFKDSPTAITITRLEDGKIIEGNESVYELLGYTHKEVIGKTTADLDIWTDPADRSRLIKALTSDGFIHNEVFILQKKDRAPVIVDLSASIINIDNQQCFISSFIDITERKKAEELLKKNEKLFKSVIENVSSGVALIDESGKFVVYNPVFLKLFGLSENSTIKNINDQNWSDWQVYDENRKLLQVDDHPVRKAAMTGKNVKNQLVGMILPAGGDIIWMLINAEPILKANDKIDMIICTYHDITAQKKAEEVIASSEREFRLLAESMPQIVWTTKPDGWNTYFNQKWVDYTGLSLEDSYGHGWNEPFHPDDQKRSWDAWQNAVLHNAPYLLQCRLRRKDGVYRWWLIHGVPVLDENEKIIKWYGTCTDIDDMRRAEEELRKSTEKLNLALENGNAGTWEWNLNTNDVIWDEQTEKMFGLLPGTFGKTFSDFENHIHEEDLPHIRQAITESLEKDVPFSTLYRTCPQIGESKYISSRASLIKGIDGKPAYMSGVCFDVTGMKKDAEQTLFKINEELLRSNKELEQFAYIASHDLQEPLRMVSSFTQLLAKRYGDKLDQDANEFIQFTVDGAKRMQDLILELLEFSRVQTKGKEFIPVDMNKVVERVIFNSKPKLNEKEGRVTSDKLPVINADESQMAQVIQNLVTNAIKFCKHAPQVHISAQTEDDQIVFSVKDNGTGIEPQFFDLIFVIFKQLQPSSEFGGTGIGLAITKRIVERHKGKIWVKSELAKGSTFYFTIPKSKA